MGNLTDIQIKNWIRKNDAVAKADGDGLTFTLSPKGTAAWVLRYRFAGKQRELSLGRYQDIPLSEARRLASAKRAEVQSGIDVGQKKRRTKQENARAWSFRYLAEDYLTKSLGRLAETTICARTQQLRDYVYPSIGTLPAKAVTPADVVDIVERTANKSQHVAHLVLIALREVLSHGVARHVIEFNPCAHVRANSVIGPRPQNRTRIMLTEVELRAMLPALPRIGRENELMVKVLLSTATRIGELVTARWEHLDFENRQWTIPSEHSKNGKRFVIPLTDHVLKLFAELHTLAFGSKFVLPIRARKRKTGDHHMEPVTLNAAINRLGDILMDKCRPFTPHDLRSTARSHLGALGVDLIVAERCLNHSLGGLIAIYDQHDYLTERRNALQQWSQFLNACQMGSPAMPAVTQLAAAI